MSWGGSTIEFLSPAADYHPAKRPGNNDSLVMRISYGVRSALLAADLVLIPAQPSPFDGWASGEMLKFIVEARGFSDCRVLPLHPMWEYLSLSDAQRSEKINQLLYGPQDYAVIGRK